jgi:glucose/arabinose dehydrogenase
MKEARTEAAPDAASRSRRGEMLRVLLRLVAIAVLLALAGCATNTTLPVRAQTGPDPRLPPPNPERIPTVHIAPAAGWTGGTKPQAAPGLEVNAFARGLDHPRWLYV